MRDHCKALYKCSSVTSHESAVRLWTCSEVQASLFVLESKTKDRTEDKALLLHLCQCQQSLFFIFHLIMKARWCVLTVSQPTNTSEDVNAPSPGSVSASPASLQSEVMIDGGKEVSKVCFSTCRWSRLPTSLTLCHLEGRPSWLRPTNNWFYSLRLNISRDDLYPCCHPSWNDQTTLDLNL